MGSEKRLTMLEGLTQAGKADSFAWYALALEYKSFERIDDALRTFRQLCEKDASYVPMYLICGTMLAHAGRVREAREWLERGMAKAFEVGNTHAAKELEEALHALPPPPSLP